MLTEPRYANLLWSYEVSDLEGRLLTIVDASLSDPQQRKAVKDLVRQNIRQWGMNLPHLESEGLDSPNFKITNTHPASTTNN